jgi:hypothetical protein
MEFGQHHLQSSSFMCRTINSEIKSKATFFPNTLQDIGVGKRTETEQTYSSDLSSCVEGFCLQQSVVMSASYASFAYEWSTFAGKCTIGLIGLIGILLYTHQDKLLYIPNPPGFPQKPTDNPIPFQSPSDWTVQGKRAVTSANSIPFEEEHLSTSDGKLIHTWLMLQANSMNVPTLIYFHGNAGWYEQCHQNDAGQNPEMFMNCCKNLKKLTQMFCVF